MLNSTPVYLKLVIAFIGIVIITFAFISRHHIKKAIKDFFPVTVLKEVPSKEGTNVLFLHHSTGQAIWDGGVASWFEQFRTKKGKEYYIVEQEFPKVKENYPFDYWNIWVKNQGVVAFENDPTLEIITKKYDVIVWKHCFPVTDIMPDLESPDINSNQKRLENYKLQYHALKIKMHEFPNTKFLVWTGAVRIESQTTEENIIRSRDFFNWVRHEWDEPGDNIFLWDFYELETEGGLYFKTDYALNPNDSHPNNSFSTRIAQLFCQRIVDVIEGRGDTSNITGEE